MGTLFMQEYMSFELLSSLKIVSQSLPFFHPAHSLILFPCYSFVSLLPYLPLPPFFISFSSWPSSPYTSVTPSTPCPSFLVVISSPIHFFLFPPTFLTPSSIPFSTFPSLPFFSYVLCFIHSHSPYLSLPSLIFSVADRVVAVPE